MIILTYFQYQRCPNGLDPRQRRRIHLEASKYIILGDFLFRRFANGFLLWCVNDEEAHRLLREIHGSSTFFIHISVHFSANATAFKIIRNGYYWPTIFHDSYKFAISYDKCQRFPGKEHLSAKPLQLVLPYFPFSKWGLDFIGLINLLYSIGNIFILTTTDYFHKWTEAVPLRNT
jgi:hypothetical protein